MARKRKLSSLGIIPVILVLTGIAVYFVLNMDNQDTRTSADNPNGTMSLTPANIAKNVGEQFTVEITVNPDNSRSGSAQAVDAILKYDKNKLNAVSIENGTIAGTYPFTNTTGINNNTGRVKVSWVGYRNNAQTPPITSSQRLATVTFSVVAQGENRIEVDFRSTGATVDSNIVRLNNGNAQDILGATTSVVVNSGQNGPPDPPDPPDTGLIGDLNGDGKISLADYSIFLQDYRACRANSSNCNTRSDLNNDNKVSLSDYSVFIQKYKEYRAANP